MPVHDVQYSILSEHRWDPRSISTRCNDYGTVVGEADNNVDFSVKAFTRSSGGALSYYQHGSSDTTFTHRNNSGVNLGVYGSSTALASASGTPFTMQGSTVTPLTITVGGKTYSRFTVWGTNRWGTIVGAFADSSGKIHAFKRFSNGSTVELDYPGAAQTVANAINDGGTIVGFYSKTASPNLWRHGFIYNNGKWATWIIATALCRRPSAGSAMPT